MKILCLSLLLLFLSCSTSHINDPPIPHYDNLSTLLKDTRDRPDLRVLYLRHHLPLWQDNDRGTLELSEALTRIGYYKESLFLGYQLLLYPMSFFYRGRNYFTIARNLHALGRIPEARYYLDKAIIRNNQYYFYFYARMEEFEKNFNKSIPLYLKALNHKYGEKEYILSAYQRSLENSLLYYKKRDQVQYHYYLDLIQEDPRLSLEKTEIIKNALVW